MKKQGLGIPIIRYHLMTTILNIGRSSRGCGAGLVIRSGIDIFFDYLHSLRNVAVPLLTDSVKTR